MSFREALTQLRSRNHHLKVSTAPSSVVQGIDALPKSTLVEDIDDELGLNDEDLLQVALAADDQLYEDVPTTPTCIVATQASSKENSAPKAWTASLPSGSSVVDVAKQNAASKLQRFSFSSATAGSVGTRSLQEAGAPPAKVRPSQVDLQGAVSPALSVTARRTNGIISPVTTTVTYDERHCVASSRQTPSVGKFRPAVDESASPVLPSSPGKRSYSFVRSNFGNPEPAHRRRQSAAQPHLPSSASGEPKMSAGVNDTVSPQFGVPVKRSSLTVSSHPTDQQSASRSRQQGTTHSETLLSVSASKDTVQAKGYSTPQRKAQPVPTVPSSQVKQSVSSPSGLLGPTSSISSNLYTPQLGTSNTALMPRRFPGPAGVLPRLLPGQRFESVQLPTTPHSGSPIICQTKVDPASNTPSSLDDIFRSSAWVAMLTGQGRTLEDGNHFLGGGMKSLLRQASSGCLRGGKASRLFVVIRSLSSSSMDASVTLADPTGEMQGTIHHKALEELPHDLCVGSVLVLRQVSVFSPTPRRHYLNIIPDNIVHVFWPEINKNSQSCGVRSYHRPERDMSPPHLADSRDVALRPSWSHRSPQIQSLNGPGTTNNSPGRLLSANRATNTYPTMPVAVSSKSSSGNTIVYQNDSARQSSIAAKSATNVPLNDAMSLQNELTAAEIEALDPGMLDAVMCDDELFADIV